MSFTGLLLVHRLAGKAGLANLLRGVVKIVESTRAAAASAASSSGSGNGTQGLLGTPASNKSTLYVYLWNNPLTDIGSVCRFSTGLYAQATLLGPSIDVRLLLQTQIPKAITNAPLTAPEAPTPKCEERSPIDAIFVASGIPSAEVARFLAENSIPQEIPRHVIFDEESSGTEDQANDSNSNSTTDKAADAEAVADKVFDVVALGGTFDRIHNGHKLLLSEAVLRCRNELIIGITDEEMIKRKTLHDLIAPYEVRAAAVQDLLREIAPSTLKLRIEPLSDPYGPAITEPRLGLLVASAETAKVGDKINAIRKERGLCSIKIHAIALYSEANKQSSHEEDKISSSSMRLRTLGERFRPPNKPASLPYIIGLTGGIASGKSNISRYLEECLGAGVIDCDKLGHQAYSKGTACFEKVVQLFGNEIVNPETGDIDRRAVGRGVFGKPEVLKQLTDIVWPEISRLVELRIEEYAKAGRRIVIVDAAVLIEANWYQFCHEVWVPFIPRDEAVRRIQERDNLSAEDAQRRIDSQLPNKERLSHATFAFSSLWEVEFTREQVRKAWTQIQDLTKDL